MRVNHKVLTTAAASNQQGNVELMNFGLDGSNNLVIEVSICCDHIGNSTVNNGYPNGSDDTSMQTDDYLQERAGVKFKKWSFCTRCQQNRRFDRYLSWHSVVNPNKTHLGGFLRFVSVLNSLQKRYFGTQEFTRFLSTVPSQRRVTRPDVSFQARESECLVTVELTPQTYVSLRETLCIQV